MYDLSVPDAQDEILELLAIDRVVVRPIPAFCQHTVVHRFPAAILCAGEVDGGVFGDPVPHLDPAGDQIREDDVFRLFREKACQAESLAVYADRRVAVSFILCPQDPVRAEIPPGQVRITQHPQDGIRPFESAERLAPRCRWGLGTFFS